MAMKRKAVAHDAGRLFKGSKASLKEDAEHEDGEEAEEQQQQPEVDDKKAVAQREQELTAARRKELKAMPASDLKELASREGLEAGNKADVIDAMLSLEAKRRAKQRAHEAEVREIVMHKKEELESLSAQDLKGLCDAAGVKGVMAKPARVETLLKQWLADDGVKKDLLKKARDAREEKLQSMDKAALRKLCTKAGVDAYVMDVMVDRVVKREGEIGRFGKPMAEESVGESLEAPVTKAAKRGKDVVSTLLEQEASKKQEKELKKQQEDAAASRKKELKAMSIENLKKMLTKKGHEAVGKKEELVEALVDMEVQEEAVATKRTQLRALSIDDLKQRITSKGLTAGKKDAMVESLLAHDAKLKEQARAYVAKVDKALEKIRGELDAKTAAELKDLCAGRGLRLGVGKPDRIGTLLEDARQNGEVEKIIFEADRRARREELLSMEKAAVLKICEALEVDPLVKEVMVERLLCHEDDEAGCGKKAEDDATPAAKRARASRK